MTHPVFSPFRIAVIEDESVQRQALMDVLRMEGYDCLGYDLPLAALADENLANADLLITDLNMPGMTGLELIQTVRQKNPEIGAILVTGRASLQTAIDAVRVGAADYVLKPFKLTTILATVSKAIEQQRLRREVARLQRDLEVRNQELILINMELDSFAARLSHDLRGPILNMKMVLQILKDEALHSLHDDVQPLILAGLKSGERATKMVQDLLAFSRLGYKDLPVEPVDLNKLLHVVLAELDSSIPPQGCVIKINDLPVVLGHDGLLQQAFTNLISNAIKYSRTKAEPRVEIASDSTATVGFVKISVTDNGVGFDAGKESQLFMPFQRLHQPWEFPGEGMGLANVKRIVERHGGEVSAEPNPEGGARFSLTLPVKDA